MKKRIILFLIFCLVLTASVPAFGSSKTNMERFVRHASNHVGDNYKSFKDRKSFTSDWCVQFIEHCSNQAGLKKAIPTSGCYYVNDIAYNMVNKKGATIVFVNKKFYDKKKSYFAGKKKFNTSYKPRKGDLIIFSDTSLYYWQHIGIVRANCSSNLRNVPTIEGNTYPDGFKKSKMTYKTSHVMKKYRNDHKYKNAKYNNLYIVAYIKPKY
ncbi:MAG: CHAP domain-containing protein [Clostridia bacterium]|nr:CHAP domain-containing protein [Clostridia bacterium]